MTSVEPQLVLSRTEWHRLIDAGVVDEDLRVELLEGRLAPMPAKSTHHAAAVRRILRVLTDLIGDDWLVSPEQPLVLSDISEPEPDLAVVPAGEYLADHPHVADALLVVEIAWTSMEQDRRKALLYRQAGAANVWIVDLHHRLVEVVGADGTTTVATETDRLSFDDHDLPVTALLP